ncbi:uncharacterized protein EV420DRAFT_1240519, partial [Desarmillaria tabescens]
NTIQWPVPIPKDAGLNLIRIEMLNLGAEYAWLDVLCLRQLGGLGEHLRVEEWKTDVPTIGAVYREAPVVCYFSGLGRPLSFKDGDFESDRCWFNRAWTLQEIPKDEPKIGGETGDDGMMDEEGLFKFKEKLGSLRQMRLGDFGESLFTILPHMQKRISTNPVDRVAGLVFLLYSDGIPKHDATQSEEDAWVALVNVLDVYRCGELFLLYPEPGTGKKHWRPTWEQI